MSQGKKKGKCVNRRYSVVKTSTWVLSLWFAAFVFWVGVMGAHWAGWRINHTRSLPLGLWHLHPIKGPIVRGQIVSFCPPDKPRFQEARQRSYLGKGSCPGDYEPLLKPVVAVAGDIVEISPKGIKVNGVLLPNSIAASLDRQGRTMPTLTNRHYQVEEAMLWVVSSYNAHSFDSRYFGAISVKQVLAVSDRQQRQ
jgi:conjugative transfer signal peptidase TraF